MKSSMRIAIVGAGVAGLTAAHHLLRRGYTHVTLYERNDRLGGKVFSYRTDAGVMELGALWAGTSYKVLMDLAHFYAVPAVEEDCQLMLHRGRKILPMLETFFADERRLEMSVALMNFAAATLRYQHEVHKIGFVDLDAALCQDFASFADKHHFVPVADAFRPFWLGCGYSDYAVTPAIYVLKLLVPILQSSIQELVSNRSLSHITNGMYWFPSGYSEIFQRIGATIPDLRLGTEVTSIMRVPDGLGFRIKITDAMHSEFFDRVIIAIEPSNILHILISDKHEQKLFSQVITHPYRMYLVRASHAGLGANKVLFFDQMMGPKDRPKVVSAMNRSTFGPRWVVGQLGGPNYGADCSEELARSTLVDDLAAAGFSDIAIAYAAAWNYFPRVSCEAISAGFYDQLEKLQGVKSTFFVGSVFSSETVEHTAAYAAELVANNF